ncbi:MAG: hypothetical protein VR72_08505 [Clostridiaceae bacterium BRH_c20a]|nr:MAG: hypothetical protein VR72_08505 [Clostridiaceae bacterium BRH_c20a]
MENINHENMQIIKRFTNELSVLGRSDNTLKEYQKVLLRAFRDIDKEIVVIKSDDIFEWLKYNYQNKSPFTYIFVKGVLNNFFNYCVRKNIIKINPVDPDWKPKTPTGTTKHLNDEEIAKVLIEVEKLDIRNRIIILLFETSGARRTEIRNLKVKDLNIKECYAKVIGKGNKPGNIYFSEECSILLQQIIEGKNRNDFVFTRKNSKSNLSGEGIYYITSKLFRSIGIKGKLGPHRFRHAFACRLNNKGVSIETIADILLHENTSTTREYLAPNLTKVINEYRRCVG